MKFSACSRTGFALALTAALAAVASPVMAEEQGSSIFANVSPSIRDRVFFRLNYINVNVKTTSGDAYDVTGPVIARGEIRARLGTNNATNFPFGHGNRANQYRTISDALDSALDQDAADPNVNCPQVSAGVGTPCGVRARSQDRVGTPALSAGYFFDDDLSWAVEAYLLASPIKVKVFGDGNNHLNGHEIIDTKLLPPTFVFGRYLGSRDSRIRPFVGVGASYAVFFNTTATDYLNQYVGGSNPGDTSVTIKNSLGVGPFVGLSGKLDETWHVSFNIGKFRYKTEATLVTRNTVITDSTPVLQDLTPAVGNANDVAETTGPNTSSDPNNPNVIQNLMCDLAASKYKNSTCNLGTYVRKQSTTLDNTMFVISVGRSF